MCACRKKDTTLSVLDTQICNEQYIEVNGTNLCYFEWGTPKAGSPTILLVHATGFHARCWDQTISHLQGRHVIAVDMRNHGRSSNTTGVGWEVYGDDLKAFVKALDLRGIVVAGHSMGGHCIVQALVDIEDRVQRAVLVDPVIMDPATYKGPSQHDSFLDDKGSHPVSRRRNYFDSVQAMYDNFEGRGSYASWLPQCLQDYCEYGLLPAADGIGFNLACPPALEASIYVGSLNVDVLELVAKISIPVTILRAKQRQGDRTELDFTASPTWPELAKKFQNGTDVYLPELTHFIPMQSPELVADYLLQDV